LAPAAATFLDRASPACIATAIHFLASPQVMRGFGQLTTAVRTGRAAVGEEQLAPDHPMWVEFARSMAPLARMMAELLANRLDASAAGPWKVLDIAAGLGLFWITLVMQARPPARDAYPFTEYERLLRNVGFARSELLELVPSPQRAVIAYR